MAAATSVWVLAGHRMGCTPLTVPGGGQAVDARDRIVSQTRVQWHRKGTVCVRR